MDIRVTLSCRYCFAFEVMFLVSSFHSLSVFSSVFPKFVGASNFRVPRFVLWPASAGVQYKKIGAP